MKTTKLTTVQKNISSRVLEQINVLQSSGEMRLPKDYSAENALKFAYLILVETKNKQGEYALEHCTQESIANALLKMVVLGLSPMKKQCDLIMYGNKLSCDVEYTGNIILAKRYGKLKYIKANAIFKGDKFEFAVDPTTALKKVVSHTQTLESLGSKDIIGAYCVYELNDGRLDTEIMSITQIRDAWNQGAMKGNSPAHKNFPDQMANKTVISRACKLLIRGSDDNVLFYAGSNTKKDVTKEDMEHAISTEANKKEISLEGTKIIEVEAETVEETKDEKKVEPIKKEEVKKEIKIESTRTNVDNQEKTPKLGF